jgi:hypothetical protein
VPDTREGPMSFSAYARRIGVSQQYVSKLVKAGKLPVTADRMIDPALADAAIRRGGDPAMVAVRESNAARRGKRVEVPATVVPPGPAPAPEPAYAESSITRATAADREAAAQLKQLRLAREAGRLVEVDRVLAAARDAFATVRAAVEPLPFRIGPQVAGLDERRAITLIEAELGRMLDELAKALDALPASLHAGTRQ